VIGEHGILPHFVAIHEIEDVAQAVVTLRHEGSIVASGLVALLRCFGDGAVSGPIEDRAVVIGRVQILVAEIADKWFMRVETLQLQEPVVFPCIALDEAAPGVKRLGLGQVLFAQLKGPIDPVGGPALLIDIGRNVRFGDLSDVRITLLAPIELPRRVTPVVGGATVLPVVVVIGT